MVFGAACCLPVFSLQGRQHAEPGVSLLLIGWLGLFEIFDGHFESLGWLANPLFLIATILLLRRQYRRAFMSGAIASGFATTSFLIHEMMINEAGHSRAVVGYGAGFWLWQAAIGLCALAPAALLMRSRRPTAQRPTPLVFDAELPAGV